MRKLIFIGLSFLLCAPFGMIAQYLPYTAQPFHYAPIFNPAFTGIENFLDVKLGYRNQWGAFKDNAPQFSNLSLNFRTKQPLDLRSNALRPSRADFTRIVPRSRLSYHGLGFNIYNMKVGPLREYGVGTNYGMHFPLTRKVTFSGGAGVMLENSRLKGGDALFWGEHVDKDDPIYVRLQEGDIGQSSIWTRVGVLLYSDRVYFGATYYPWNTVLGDDNVSFEDQFYLGSIQAGFSFTMNEDFDVKPSIMAFVGTDNTVLIDYHVKLFLQEKAWFGLTYRDIKAGALSGGLHINTMLSFSYSYEFSMGKLRTFSGSTHELMLAGRLKNYKRLMQRTW